MYRYRNIDLAFSSNIVIVFVKLFKYVKLSPQLSIVTETLNGAVRSASSFFVIFALLLFCFAMCFWFTYGHLIWEFRTIPNALYACVLALLAGEYGVFVHEAYYHNTLFGPLGNIIFMFLMSMLAFSMLIAMVEDAYESAKARSKQKKGLDPLLVQFILFVRKTRKFCERSKCCPCVHSMQKGAHANKPTLASASTIQEDADTTDLSLKRRRKLSRETTVLDMITGKGRTRNLTFWQLITAEIMVRLVLPPSLPPPGGWAVLVLRWCCSPVLFLCMCFNVDRVYRYTVMHVARNCVSRSPSPP